MIQSKEELEAPALRKERSTHLEAAHNQLNRKRFGYLQLTQRSTPHSRKEPCRPRAQQPEIESAQALVIGGSRPRAAASSRLLSAVPLSTAADAGPSVPRNARCAPRLGGRRGQGSAPPMSSRTGFQRGRGHKPDEPGTPCGPSQWGAAHRFPCYNFAHSASHRPPRACGQSRRFVWGTTTETFPPPRCLSPPILPDASGTAVTSSHTPTPHRQTRATRLFSRFHTSSSLAPAATTPWPSCLPCPSGPPA